VVSGALGHQVDLVTAVSRAFGRQVGSGTAVSRLLDVKLALFLVARQAGRAGRAGQAGRGKLILAQGKSPRAALDVTLALERRFQRPLEVKLALDWRFREILVVFLRFPVVSQSLQTL